MNKKILVLIISILLIYGIGICFGVAINNRNSEKDPIPTQNNNEELSENKTQKNQVNTEKTNNSKILVAYFSKAGENYSVGTVEVGNTEIMAKNIAEMTGGDLFKIEPIKDYPNSYKEATNVAQEEKSKNARPEIKSKVENFEQYDTIFIGYPIWYGDMPMIIYSFLESYNFEGKTIVPFDTNEGSGNAGTYSTIKNKLKNSNVLDGLAIRGSEARKDDSKTKIENWLKQIGLLREGEYKNMYIELNDKKYDVILDNNKTTSEILKNTPIKLSMSKYANHEYYSELPFTPTFDENRTSQIKAGHIYYWDGWNAFVINYEDYDISPYKVVHIGEIVDKSIIDILSNNNDNIDIIVSTD